MRPSSQGDNSPLRDTGMKTKSIICITGLLTEVNTECGSIIENEWLTPLEMMGGMEFVFKGQQELTWDGKKV